MRGDGLLPFENISLKPSGAMRVVIYGPLRIFH